MINIELTTEQAEFWKDCMKHEQDIRDIFNEKVFDIKRGKAELHFDKNGVLRSITKTQTCMLHN